MFKAEISSESLTILVDFEYTIACKGCNFDCSPKVTSKLIEKKIADEILQAKLAFSSLRKVIFSGGECFLLKEILLRSIAFSNELGLETKCITNAYWANNVNDAHDVASGLSKSGLAELEVITGVEQQSIVDLRSVINAADATTKKSILTTISIHTDSPNASCLHYLSKNRRIVSIYKDRPRLLRLNSLSIGV